MYSDPVHVVLMTDFPSLTYTSICEIPTLSYTCRLRKVPVSGGPSPYCVLLGVPFLATGFCARMFHCALLPDCKTTLRGFGCLVFRSQTYRTRYNMFVWEFNVIVCFLKLINYSSS